MSISQGWPQAHSVSASSPPHHSSQFAIQSKAVHGFSEIFTNHPLLPCKKQKRFAEASQQEHPSGAPAPAQGIRREKKCPKQARPC